MHLVFQSTVQGIDLAFEMIVQRLLAESAILGSGVEQFSQQRNLTGFPPRRRTDLV
jgi:hypothetical protein